MTLTRRKRKPTKGGVPYKREEDRRAAWAWHAHVIRGGCVMCRAFPVPAQLRRGRTADLKKLEGHHVVGRRHLKRERLQHLDWITDNGICLCRYHHGRHEHALQRVPRYLLPATAVTFAEQLGLGWIIDREYL